MNIANLLVTLSIEVRQLLPSWCAQSFLEVAMETLPSLSSLVSDSITGIDAFCFIGCLVFGIELGQSIREARGDAMLVVQGYGALDGIVANDVAVGQVLGDNT